MSEKGYDMGSGSGGVSVQPSGADFDAAAEDCLSQVGEPPIDPPSAEQQKQIDEARLAFYECLRREGYEAETPQSGGGAGSTGGMGGAPQDVIESCGEESGY
jgi:hypothetical protein